MSKIIMLASLVLLSLTSIALLYLADQSPGRAQLRKKKISFQSGISVLSSSPFDNLRRHPTRREILTGKPPGIYVVDPSDIDGVTQSGVISGPAISTTPSGPGGFDTSDIGKPVPGYTGNVGRPGGIFESASSFVPGGAILWSGPEEDTWMFDTFRRVDRDSLQSSQVWASDPNPPVPAVTPPPVVTPPPATGQSGKPRPFGFPGFWSYNPYLDEEWEFD